MRYSQWPSPPEVRGAVPHQVLGAVKRMIPQCGAVRGALLHGQLLELAGFVIQGVFYSTEIPDLPPSYLLEATVRPFVPAYTTHPGLTSKAVLVYCT